MLFVNDCLPVVLALRKGSHFTLLQVYAEEVTLSLLEAGEKGSFLHIQGKEMVASGTGGASREGAQKSIGTIQHSGWKGEDFGLPGATWLEGND